MNKKKKEHFFKYTLGAMIIAGFLTASFLIPHPGLEKNEDEGTWHIIWQGNSASAEADPGAGASGWLATFCLDYAETPGTCLASNASGGGYDSWGNVSGYVDTDDTETDLASEDPFYFVVRCRFNDTVKDGVDFRGDRCKVALTVSGDETISDVEITGDDADIAAGGRAVISQNDTADDYIWINFVWDDNSDGYRITDDGSLAWNITISAKY